MFFKRSAKINLDDIRVKLNVNDTKSFSILQMLDLTEHDLKYLKNLKPAIMNNIDQIVDRFYSVISSDEEMVAIIDKHSSVDRLKKSIVPHILEMFDGEIDSRYIDKRQKVAKMHVTVGLNSKKYIMSFTSILKDAMKLIDETMTNLEDASETRQAVIKIISLEKYLVLDKFDEVVEQQQQELQKKKDELNSSIIESSTSLAAISEETNASHHLLRERVHYILEYTMKAKQVAINMTNKANEGKNAIQRQIESMEHIILSVAKIEEEIMGLSAMNKQIEEVVKSIQEISNQTKLISFNAQIEAAHAGEYGKGFNVVAQEVRKLSDESAESIKLANNLLSTIHDETDRMRTAISKVNSAVQGGTINLNNTETSFEEIKQFTVQNEDQSNLIQNEITDLEQVIKELSLAFDEVANQADKLAIVSSDLDK